MHKILKLLEKQILRGLGKGHGTKSIATEVNGIRGLLGSGEIKTCVDIGGNVGNYTAELLKQFPAAEVFTFEPSQTNIEILRARFASERRVHLLPFAVSDTEGEATLYSDTPGSGLSSLSKRDLNYRGLSFDQTETVRTVRFDDFWRSEMSSRDIDILKLDIEGHELAALQCSSDALRQTRAIQFEFGGCNIDTRSFFRDFWNFFAEREFTLHRITPFGLLPIVRYSERDEIFTTTNYIAIKK